MSAISKTPVEIWAKIFDHLLYDSGVFDPNPFYEGCNPHTAMREWYNPKRVDAFTAQLSTLRLVSHSWNTLTRPKVHRFLKSSEIFAASNKGELAPFIWQSAFRIHFEVKTVCRCDNNCFCMEYGYVYSRVTALPREDIMSVVDTLSQASANSSPPARILFMTSWVLHVICAQNGNKSIGDIFRGVKALGTIGQVAITFALPQVLYSIEFLDLGHGYPAFSPNEPLEFPKLKTLRCQIESEYACRFFQAIEAPRLKNLDLLGNMGFGHYCLVMGRLQKGWPTLSTLTLNFDVRGTRPRVKGQLWNGFPNLSYLGVKQVLMALKTTSPGQHQLKTLGIKTGKDRSTLASCVSTCLSHWLALETLADSHIWEDIPLPYLRNPPDSTNSHQHDHLPDADTCYLCTLFIHNHCFLQEIRYEDRLGRSLLEYLASLGD